MNLKTTALIIRKDGDGLQIFGKSLDSLELIKDGEYLFLGEITLEPKHIFHKYKKDAGNTPDSLLLYGGLNHKNYKEKIL